MYPGMPHTRPGSMAESWVPPPKGQELTERDQTLDELYAKPNGTARGCAPGVLGAHAEWCVDAG